MSTSKSTATERIHYPPVPSHISIRVLVVLLGNPVNKCDSIHHQWMLSFFSISLEWIFQDTHWLHWVLGLCYGLNPPPLGLESRATSHTKIASMLNNHPNLKKKKNTSISLSSRYAVDEMVGMRTHVRDSTDQYRSACHLFYCSAHHVTP